MNILNVNISIDSSKEGGTAERTYQMSRFLAKSNHQCSILTLFSELSSQQKEELKDIKLIMLPYLSKRFYIPKGGFKAIRKAVSEADIVHLMNHWNFLNAFVYCFIRYFNKPYVVCPAGALPIYGRSKKIKKIYNFLIGNKIIKNAQGHIAVAENEFAQYKSYGIEEKQITLIPNGVNIEEDYDLISTQGKINLPEHYFLFIGRLNYIKGPDLLVHAFSLVAKQYEAYHLVFAGPDSGMLDELKKSVEELNLVDRIHFIGYVTGFEKINLLQKASFLVIPSRQEAMSVVLLEAGAMVKPVLMTDQCGFNQLADLNGGYVVPATIKGLEEGLIKMLSNPKRDLMGKNLQDFILKNYTWNSVGKNLIRLFSKFVGEKDLL